MPSLSQIQTEAKRLVGRLPETRRVSLQSALLDLCETHWLEIRGPEPASKLAQSVWCVTPPLADLLFDLYCHGDARLDEILNGRSLAHGMALLVLAEIERGNEFGVQIAHEPMMAFETAKPPAIYTERVSQLLRRTLEPPTPHRHNSHPPIWKAVATIAARIRRVDLPAILCVIRALATDNASATVDSTREDIQSAVLTNGIRFLNFDNAQIHFQQHGHDHKPVRIRQIGDDLLELRRKWFAH